MVLIYAMLFWHIASAFLKRNLAIATDHTTAAVLKCYQYLTGHISLPISCT